MKCKKQPPFKLPEEIKNVWEVILDSSIWTKIQSARNQTKSTYSWIVRYCVFKLINNPDLDVLIAEATEHRSKCFARRGDGHRLQLCLYGEDEDALRLIAFKNKISISALIRIAIDSELKKLIEYIVSKKINFKKVLVRIAVKVFEEIHTHFTRKKKQLMYGSIHFVSKDQIKNVNQEGFT